MATYVVSSDQYVAADRRMSEIRRQLAKGMGENAPGSNINPTQLLADLQTLVEGGRVGEIVSIPADTSLRWLFDHGYAAQVGVILRQTWARTLSDLPYFAAEDLLGLEGFGMRKLSVVNGLMKQAGINLAPQPLDKSDWIQLDLMAIPIPLEKLIPRRLVPALRLSDTVKSDLGRVHVVFFADLTQDLTPTALYEEIFRAVVSSSENADAGVARERAEAAVRELSKELKRIGFSCNNWPRPEAGVISTN